MLYGAHMQYQNKLNIISSVQNWSYHAKIKLMEIKTSKHKKNIAVILISPIWLKTTSKTKYAYYKPTSSLITLEPPSSSSDSL